MDATAREAVFVQLQLDEGFRGTLYPDTVGVPTIGYGHNLQRPISRRAAAVILDDDLEGAILAAETFDWFATLDATRQAVIVNMLFNLGLTRFLTFRKMIAAIARRDFATAALEMLDSRWATQVGSRAHRLSREMARGDAQETSS